MSDRLEKIKGILDSMDIVITDITISDISQKIVISFHIAELSQKCFDDSVQKMMIALDDDNIFNGDYGIYFDAHVDNNLTVATCSFSPDTCQYVNFHRKSAIHFFASHYSVSKGMKK